MRADQQLGRAGSCFRIRMRVEKLFQLNCTFREGLCEREFDFIDLVEFFFLDLFRCFLYDRSFGLGC